MMNKISEILRFPAGTSVDQVSGRILNVGDKKPMGNNGSQVQNFDLDDGSGKIQIGFWNMDDFKQHDGRELVVTGGLKVGVRENKGKTYVSITTSKETKVAFATAKPNATPQPSSNAPQVSGNGLAVASGTIRGDKVGMALKVAADFMVGQASPFTKEEIKSIASDIIRVSNELEAGDLSKPKDASSPDVPY